MRRTRTPREEDVVNRALMSGGFGKLDDPNTIRQIGFVVGRGVKTHDDFRKLINRCEPERRRDMYETLKPYITFPLDPLDLYISRNLEEAERKQMPTVDPVSGHLVEFKIPEVRSLGAAQKTGDLLTAQEALDRASARIVLTLDCKHCLREATFPAMRRDEAVLAARTLGWEHRTPDGAEPYELCPKCSHARKHILRPISVE